MNIIVYTCIPYTIYHSFSRKILWLEAGASNNNPHIVANYYVNCVRQLKGICLYSETDVR